MLDELRRSLDRAEARVQTTPLLRHRRSAAICRLDLLTERWRAQLRNLGAALAVLVTASVVTASMAACVVSAVLYIKMPGLSCLVFFVAGQKNGHLARDVADSIHSNPAGTAHLPTRLISSVPWLLQ